MGAQDQTLIAPVVSVPPRPDKIAIPVEESSRKVVETGKQFVNTPTISIIKPYFQQMAERTYPWIERDTVYNLQHELQNFDICLPRPLEESPIESTVWVFFLHGGAWRDVKQDKSEINPALEQLLSSTSSSSKHTLKHIAGIVSLNYGLSLYPPDDDSQDPSLRLVHPKHISDVVVALGYFQNKYNVGAKDENGNAIGHDYIIVGHSAGATLAFQSWVQRCDCATYRPPKAIVGLAGIYDLPAVVRNHSEIPFYRKMITGAFGPDESTWVMASPVSDNYDEQWEAGGLDIAVLAASEDDDLIETEQWRKMKALLEVQGWKMVDVDGEPVKKDGRQRELVVLPLKGRHDEIWEKGDELRRSIETVIARLYPQ